MRVPIAFALMLVLTGSSAALAQDVRYNFDKQSNFAGFRTYRWVALKGAQPLSDLTDRQIKAAIDVELSKKGLTLAERKGQRICSSATRPPSTPKSSSRHATQVMDTAPAGTDGGWCGHGGGGRRPGPPRRFTSGRWRSTCTPTPQALVWRGVVSKTLDQNAKPDKQQKNLAKAMTKLLKNYPPPIKK